MGVGVYLARLPACALDPNRELKAGALGSELPDHWGHAGALWMGQRKLCRPEFQEPSWELTPVAHPPNPNPGSWGPAGQADPP